MSRTGGRTRGSGGHLLEALPILATLFFAVSCWGNRFYAECRPLSEPFHKIILKEVFIRFILLGAYRRPNFCVSLPRYRNQWIEPVIEPVEKANQFLKAFRFGVFFLLLLLTSKKAKPGCCRRSVPVGFLVPGKKLPWQQEKGRKEDSGEGQVKGFWSSALPAHCLTRQALCFSYTHTNFCHLPGTDIPTYCSLMCIS